MTRGGSQRHRKKMFIEMQCFWKMNCMTKAVESEATGLVTKGLENVEAIPEKNV